MLHNRVKVAIQKNKKIKYNINNALTEDIKARLFVVRFETEDTLTHIYMLKTLNCKFCWCQYLWIPVFKQTTTADISILNDSKGFCLFVVLNLSVLMEVKIIYINDYTQDQFDVQTFDVQTYMCDPPSMNAVSKLTNIDYSWCTLTCCNFRLYREVDWWKGKMTCWF